jgi:hypothetical protein
MPQAMNAYMVMIVNLLKINKIKKTVQLSQASWNTYNGGVIQTSIMPIGHARPLLQYYRLIFLGWGTTVLALGDRLSTTDPISQSREPEYNSLLLPFSRHSTFLLNSFSLFSPS